MGRFLVLALLLIFGFACSKKPTSVANLAVTNSFAFGATAGGYILYIHDKLAGTVHSKILRETENKIELANSTYEFRIVGWDGNAPFNGALFCGRSDVNLTGGEQTVDLTVNKGNCRNEAFARPRAGAFPSFVP